MFDPNALLLDRNGQPTNVPVFVVSTTQPSLQPGQCWLNPNDQSTWVPCPTAAVNAALRNQDGEPLGPDGKPVATAAEAAPLYVQAATKPASMLPGQCWLDPANPQPCAQAGATNIWWDVFPIPAPYAWPKGVTTTSLIPGYFHLRSNFDDYPGHYVIHCHILAHEDRGMMAEVNLAVPAGAANTHHH